ncbi:MAG: hypothetical protein ACHQQQ_11610 [Bacteroidota bacterium]
MRNIFKIYIAIMMYVLPISVICQTSGQGNTYTITASSGKHGSISPSGIIPVTGGGIQAFSIKPDAGYNIVNLLIDGDAIEHDTSYTFSNVSHNHTIAAAFAKDTDAAPSSDTAQSGFVSPAQDTRDSITITAAAGAYGTITPSGTITLPYGGEQSFTMIPAPGYSISKVIIDGVKMEAVEFYTFENVTAPHSIRVEFAKNE